MSDVEKYYYTLQSKLGGTTKWKELTPQQQHNFITAINIILTTCTV